MSDVCWALFSAEGGCVAQVVLASGALPTKRDSGGVAFARAVRTSRQADLSIERVEADGTISEDAAKVEALLIGWIKVEAERRKMLNATGGGYKKAEYAAKRMEVIAWDELGGTPAAILAAFTTMVPSRRALTFEYAMADATAGGDQPADAIARFRRGITASSDASRLAGIEARACALIRAAATAAAKRAAYAAINWS